MLVVMGLTGQAKRYRKQGRKLERKEERKDGWTERKDGEDSKGGRRQ